MTRPPGPDQPSRWPAPRGQIGAGIPRELPDEQTSILAASADTRIERIVSRGHVSPPGFWYEQAEDEWVMVVAGAARLEIEGEGDVELRVGDWIDLARGVRHRVAWTDPARDTIWLAVFRR
jgi:cupin 2 domain-containing protein